ncbi:MAG: hypothetical protein ACRDWT_19325 [Jatrophihabitantaceae bacterium]
MIVVATRWMAPALPAWTVLWSPLIDTTVAIGMGRSSLTERPLRAARMPLAVMLGRRTPAPQYR